MHRVLFDCDPGIDDTLALLYLAALHHAGEIELMGVTTSAGNVSVGETARNAAWALEILGLSHVPVAPGQPSPLAVPLVTTPETHGQHGVGYLSPPDSFEYAADWRAIWRRAQEVGAHLIITGPLTNAATWAAGRSFDGFASLNVMGGAVNYRGNTTPTAEWNFHVDPHAAARFFEKLGHSGHLATLCSLEVTEQFLIDPPRLDQLIDVLGDAPIATVLPELLRFYFEFHEAQGEGYQAQIHDLLTTMIALDRITFDAVETTIAVEADSPLLRGTSVADLRSHWDAPHNARLVTAADVDAAHTELLRAARFLAE